MARTGVTEQQVHQAADALLQGGERPTIERVRALLGTGSPNTLIRLLDSWWIDLGSRLATQEKKLALPDAPIEVVNAASALWTGALAHAKAVAVTDLERDRAQVERQRNDLLQREGEWHAQLDVAGKEASQAREAQDRAETRYSDIERLADQLAAQLDDLKGQRLTLGRERDELGTRLAVTERRLVDQAAASTAERLALEAQFRASEDRWLQEVDRSRQDVNKLQTRLGKAEQAAEIAAQKARLEIESLRASLRAAERALAASESKAGTLDVEISRLHKRFETTIAIRKNGSPRKVSPPAQPKKNVRPSPKRKAVR